MVMASWLDGAFASVHAVTRIATAQLAVMTNCFIVSVLFSGFRDRTRHDDRTLTQRAVNGGTVERWNGGTVERWNGGTKDHSAFSVFRSPHKRFPLSVARRPGIASNRRG